ncbi:hypothetical protein ACIQ6Y_33290 [Streptomyces sp. NPDC096205]|uniref:hypothetical protein n=1 Tax=Streptomyces sp. NPDC096205 TaxID=3366081 RepID=UPI003822A5F9
MRFGEVTPVHPGILMAAVRRFEAPREPVRGHNTSAKLHRVAPVHVGTEEAVGRVGDAHAAHQVAGGAHRQGAAPGDAGVTGTEMGHGSGADSGGVEVCVDVDACDHSFTADRTDPVVHLADDLAYVDEEQAVLFKPFIAGEVSGEELDVSVRQDPSPQPAAEFVESAAPGPARGGSSVGRDIGEGAAGSTNVGVGFGAEESA